MSSTTAIATKDSRIKLPNIRFNALSIFLIIRINYSSQSHITFATILYHALVKNLLKFC